jgi:formylglycine-generating enzyme required for sulfatase activity
MNTSTCPAAEVLRAYLLGELDAAGDESVDFHMEDCGPCQAALDALDRDVNAVFAGLRPAPVSAGIDDPLLRRLADRAKGLGPGRHEASALVPGSILGNYLLLEALGAGGMGRVYRAEHRRMKRQVAVKVIAPELLRSAPARARFQREVEAVARLSSPHIVAAYDAGDDDGRDFLVMEYVEGCNLADLVKRHGPLPVEAALRYTLQAARGLAHAHDAGVYHRDVKPANLLLARDDTVKVLDLGLAHLRDEEPPPLAASSGVLGTAHFMAPEQASHAADARADVYSLGCTLFYLLTGRPPHEGHTTTTVLRAHRERPFPCLRQARPDCPEELERLLDKLVARQPERRLASMGEVIAACERLLDGAPPRAVRRGWLGAACALVAVGGLLFALRGGDARPQQEGVAAGTPQRPVVIAAPDRNDKPATTGRVASTATPVIPMVRIPAGEFWMGSPDSDRHAAADEKPRQRVRITLPFLLGKTEVTQAQYQEVMGTNPSAFGPRGRFKNRLKVKDTALLPVESVSWLDAVRFCNRLSERLGLTPYYKIDGERVTIRGGTAYRLPTEAEWEYACRGGKSTTWCFGENAEDLGRFAWFAGNAGGATHAVGQKKANPFGLFDMAGNVPEWCWDRYDPAYYARLPSSDPPGAGFGDIRVFRGGAWNSRAPETRAASRNSLGIAYSVQTIVGIRVARNAE